MKLRGLAGPIAVGVATAIAMPFIGWWSVLILIGFIMGYSDPWDAQGNAR